MADVVEERVAPAAESETAPTLLAPLREDAPDDLDSAYASSVAGSGTTSLKSSITKYREENGRTYHSYGSTEYWGPNDEKAQDLNDLSHFLWTLALKGDLFLSPVKDPERILDIGTGTGIWVIEVAEQYSQATVTGTDLSAIQPPWVPPNAFFDIDDFNVDWLDYDKFDLIHARELLGTCPDWLALYKKALAALKPGGWYEQHEPGMYFLSDHVKFAADHPYTQWGTMMTEAGIKAGMRFDIGDKMKGWMEEAGFINVKEVRQIWPIGPWAKDKHRSQVGQWNQLRIDMGVADFCSRRFSNHMGLSPEEIGEFCARMRAALREKKVFTYQLVYFVYGQKPEST